MVELGISDAPAAVAEKVEKVSASETAAIVTRELVYVFIQPSLDIKGAEILLFNRRESLTYWQQVEPYDSKS